MPLDFFDEHQPAPNPPRMLWALLSNIGAFTFAGASLLIMYIFPSPSQFAVFLGLREGSNAPEFIVFSLVGLGAILAIATLVFWIIYIAKIYNMNTVSQRPSVLPAVLGLASIALAVLGILFYLFS